MAAELWLEKRCVHGLIGCGELICDHRPGEHKRDEHGTFGGCWCPGGSRVRLDPDKVVFEIDALGETWRRTVSGGYAFWDITVQDVIDALEEE